MNTVILLGNLVKEPEVRTSAKDVKVINFTLAVNKKYKEEKQTSYINCVAFNKTAEILAQYTQKGSRVIVEGELSSRSYDNKEGQKVYITEVIVSQLTIVDFKPKDEPNTEMPSSSRTARLNDIHKETIEKRKEEAKEITLDDGDLPF